jgi:hypothetical protein
VNIYVGFPIHSRPTAHFMGSFLRLISEADKDMTFGFDFKINVSNLAAERCIIAHEALKMNADVLLFIDDDITFEPKTAMSIIRSAVEERAVVAATYRVKTEKVRHVGFTLEQVNQPPETKGTLKGMASIGMGLTAIHMDVIRRILAKHKMGVHEVPFFHSSKFPGEEIAGLFEFKIGEDFSGERRFIGEDECFCAHAIRTGSKVWIDTEFTVGHVGQFVYR